MALKIEDYALIGDCETAALAGLDGSIDWLCWPRFDSDACFAAILGTPEHGRWQIAPPAATYRSRRAYHPSTLILETQFDTAEGEVALIDFMPIRSEHSHLVRLVRGKRGTVRMQMELTIRFDYGRSVPWVSQINRVSQYRGQKSRAQVTEDRLQVTGDGEQKGSHLQPFQMNPGTGALRAIAGPDMVVLRTPVPTHGENLKTVADFTISEGQTVPFVLSYGPSHLGVPRAIDPEEALRETTAFWKEWTGRCTYRGPWMDAVQRSLVTLKALTYKRTGGIVAAPTTSLPEHIGGRRNWDYRFCWLRDASFTLFSLMRAGYQEEATAWQNWLIRAVAGSPEQVQIMYGLAGERQLEEWEVPWLPGYEESKPVRIGNAASNQLQLDIYGEISGALLHSRKGGLAHNGMAFELEKALLDQLEKIWREPDEGIWEVRGPRQHFTHSKVMAWVAFDRTIKSAEQFGLPGPVERWRAVRQQIHDEVCKNAFNTKLGSFTQAYGSSNLDASLLLIPMSGFLPPSDERVQGTVRAIERELFHGGFVLRYNTGEVDDGLPPGEGVFLPCSFWLATVYAMTGRLAEAKDLFEKLLALRNDVGLLAEEYDPVEKRLLGNFPQAFSHVSLVNAAHRLTEVLAAEEKEAA